MRASGGLLYGIVAAFLQKNAGGNGRNMTVMKDAALIYNIVFAGISFCVRRNRLMLIQANSHVLNGAG